MKTVEHLTKEQLAGYATRSLAQTETHEIGKHLLQCADCRNLLPAPTPEQFWSALMDETEREEIMSDKKSSLAKNSSASSIFSFFRERQALAWSACALILAAGFSFLIWVGTAKQSNMEREVAQTIETEKIQNDPPIDEKSSVPTGDAVSSVDAPENPQQPTRPKQSNNNLPTATEDLQKPEKMEDKELAVLLENTPPAVSSLRPNDTAILRGNRGENSKPAKTFALLGPIGETVLEAVPQFRWEKEENARSYKVSILDTEFNEVLTAQVSGNSYQPDKPLKRGAKYLWRVAAQTENGEIVSPLPPQPPAMFRIADEKAESQIKSLKKTNADQFKLAVFYAQEGMLDSAACMLKEILAKNPKHKAASRLLAKVEQWKKENQTTTQRCGPLTATKADQ